MQMIQGKFLKPHLLPVVMLMAYPVIAQTSNLPSGNIRKNAIYVSGDMTSALVSSTLNYERTLFNPDLKLVRYLNASLSYGKWFAISAGGPNYTVAVHAVTGQQQHHLEATLGLRIHFDKIDYEFELEHGGNASKKDYILNLPQIGVGYRYQKPAGILVFRASAGIPYFQLSVGFAF